MVAQKGLTLPAGRQIPLRLRRNKKGSYPLIPRILCIEVVYLPTV